tara:strand:- start:1779 stop:2411 length:633 start_codon:yes stop_codon:yes gene_type:complete
MSLIAKLEAERANKSRGEIDESEKESKILQPATLMRILNESLDAKCVNKKTAKAWSSYRHRVQDVGWPLENLLGSVTPEIWSNICEGAIAGMLKTIRHSQSNGDWQITEYEADIRRDRDGRERVMVAVKWVDAKNQNDLTYQNGIPSNLNVNIKQAAIPDEVINAITNRGNSSNDDELKELLKGLVSEMAQARKSNEEKPAPEEGVHLAE